MSAHIRSAAPIRINPRDIDERFVRSSGPGGQNVNKVSSAVELRFDTAKANLPFDMKQRLRAIAGSRMTKDGILVLHASRFRDQQRNRDDARKRLAAILERAADLPRPREKTKIPRASKEKRLTEKRARSGLKRLRSGMESD